MTADEARELTKKRVAELQVEKTRALLEEQQRKKQEEEKWFFVEKTHCIEVMDDMILKAINEGKRIAEVFLCDYSKQEVLQKYVKLSHTLIKDYELLGFKAKVFKEVIEANNNTEFPNFMLRVEW